MKPVGLTDAIYFVGRWCRKVCHFLCFQCLTQFYLTNYLMWALFIYGQKNVYNSQLMLTLFDLAKN